MSALACRLSPRARARVRSTALDVDSPSRDKNLISIRIATEDARKWLKFDALIVGDNDRAIYVAAVARDCELEQSGVVPGMRLRAISNPVDKDSLWMVSNTERLAFVRDAIRSTKQEEITLVFDARESAAVTAEMVRASMNDDEIEEERQREERARERNSTPVGKRVDANGKKIEDRPDLYSENWQGAWNWIRQRLILTFFARRGFLRRKRILERAYGWASDRDRYAAGDRGAGDGFEGRALGRDAILRIYYAISNCKRRLVLTNTSVADGNFLAIPRPVLGRWDGAHLFESLDVVRG